MELMLRSYQLMDGMIQHILGDININSVEQKIKIKQLLITKCAEIYDQYFTPSEIDNLLQIFQNPVYAKFESLSDKLGKDLIVVANDISKELSLS